MGPPSSATFKRPPARRPTLLDATVLRHRLIGQKIPADFALQGTAGQQLRLGRPSGALVVYLFPGSTSSPAHGQDTPLADAEEHRSFREAREPLSTLGLVVLGVSSQPEAKLKEAIDANRLRHPLACDPALTLGELLDLPTFPAGGGRVYERLTILVIAATITQVFYPVPAPGRAAQEVLDHLTPGR
jgi:peroxiredoxin